MRLTLIIASLNSGGAQRVLCELANYWIKKGHQVSLVTLDPLNSSSFYDLNPMVKQVNLNQQSSTRFFLKRALNILKRLFYLRVAIKNLKPDRIISFVDITNITTLIASLGLKIPIIVSERSHPAYYHIAVFYRLLRQLLYWKALRVVVQTESAASYFTDLSNVQVIPNGVTLPLKVKVEQDYFVEVRNIISVGRLCPFKGFDTLIRAFSNLLQYYPDLRLTIYGEGLERSKLEQLIENLALEKKVYLPGATKTIQEVLIQADLFVFPSHYEGFPNALSEAMAVGLPVIASDCVGNIDIVREGIDGRFFPIGDVERLTVIVRELIADPLQRQRLGLEAQTLPKRFKTASILAQWDQAIENQKGKNLERNA